MQIFSDFDEAKGSLPEGMSLCGAYKGDEPVYFHMPASATDQAMREAAFEIREGRPMSQYERDLLALAIQQKELADAR